MNSICWILLCGLVAFSYRAANQVHQGINKLDQIASMVFIALWFFGLIYWAKNLDAGVVKILFVASMVFTSLISSVIAIRYSRYSVEFLHRYVVVIPWFGLTYLMILKWCENRNKNSKITRE
jgi:uncharacterized membrane protein YfcA